MLEFFQNAVFIMSNVFVVLNTVLVLKYVFGRDMRCNIKALTLTGLSFLVMDIADTLLVPEQFSWIAFLIIDAGLVAAVFFLTRQKRFVTLVLIIPAILFYMQVSFVLTVLEVFTGLNHFFIIAGNGEVITPIYVICDPLLFIILLMLIRHTDRRIQDTCLKAPEVIVLTIFSAVVIYASGVIQTLKDENRFYFVVSALILFAFEALILYAIYHRKRSGYYRRLSQEYRKQFESEYSFFKDYKATQEDTIRFRHDWKNHMLLLKEMLAKREYHKAEDYFAKLSENTPDGSRQPATGNELADMIIGIKSEKMEELEISFHFKGNLKELNSMEQVDCCVLLSNLLDNAIEANAKLENSRYIILMSRRTENLFYMEMKNPSDAGLQKEGTRILSTKKTHDPCGIGLENVDAIVRKYHGECRIFVENGEFVFQMLFPVE